MESSSKNITLEPEKCVNDIVGKEQIKGIIEVVTESYVILKDGRWFTNPSTVSKTTRKHHEYINGKWVKKK